MRKDILTDIFLLWRLRLIFLVVPEAGLEPARDVTLPGF